MRKLLGTLVAVLAVFASPNCGPLPRLAAESTRKTSVSKVSFSFGRAKATPTPPAMASPTPEVKHTNLPFKSRVVSVDKAHHSFRIGKKKLRLIRVLPDTKLFKGDGTNPAMFSDIVIGVEVRGSLHRTENGSLEAVSLKLGPKAEPATVSAEAEGDTLP